MQKVYPEGIRFFKPNDKAPEFVLANVSIDQKKMIEWLAAQNPNDKGYIRMDLLRGKETPYLVLNTYVPK